MDSDPASSRDLHAAALALMCLAAVPVEGLWPRATVVYEMICVSVLGFLIVNFAAWRSSVRVSNSALRYCRYI